MLWGIWDKPWPGGKLGAELSREEAPRSIVGCGGVRETAAV